MPKSNQEKINYMWETYDNIDDTEIVDNLNYEYYTALLLLKLNTDRCFSCGTFETKQWRKANVFLHSRERVLCNKCGIKIRHKTLQICRHCLTGNSKSKHSAAKDTAIYFHKIPTCHKCRHMLEKFE